MLQKSCLITTTVLSSSWCLVWWTTHPSRTTVTSTRWEPPSSGGPLHCPQSCVFQDSRSTASFAPRGHCQRSDYNHSIFLLSFNLELVSDSHNRVLSLLLNLKIILNSQERMFLTFFSLEIVNDFHLYFSFHLIHGDIHHKHDSSRNDKHGTRHAVVFICLTEAALPAGAAKPSGVEDPQRS